MRLSYRRVLLLTLLVLAILGTLGWGITAARAQRPADPPPKAAPTSGAPLAPTLAQQFAAAGPGAQLPYWVILKDQADTHNSIPNSDWAAKGWYVYNVLRAQAD